MHSRIQTASNCSGSILCNRLQRDCTYCWSSLIALWNFIFEKREWMVAVFFWNFHWIFVKISSTAMESSCWLLIGLCICFVGLKGVESGVTQYNVTLDRWYSGSVARDDSISFVFRYTVSFMFNYRLLHRSIGWSVDWLMDELNGRLIDCLIAGLIDWLIDAFINID